MLGVVKEAEGLGALAGLLSLALSLCGVRVAWRSGKRPRGTRTRLPFPRWTDFDRAPTSYQTRVLLSPSVAVLCALWNTALGTHSTSPTELLLFSLLQVKRGGPEGFPNVPKK